MNFFTTYICVLSVCSLFAFCAPAPKKNILPKTTEQDLITLGRHLFYDRRLSLNNTKSCASCHAQQFSFTDNYTRSIGALGDLHKRNARPLINLSYSHYFTAGDSSIKNLEQQMDGPMLNTHPVELGIKGNEAAILEKIKADTLYQTFFTKNFPLQPDPYSFENIKKAIAAFEQTIVSTDAPYDKFIKGDTAALTQQQQQGMQLFFSNSLNCNNCHGGKNFNTPVLKNINGTVNFYHKTVLYSKKNSFPDVDQGLFESTRNEADKGKFRVPTLRNLAYTAPYYHNGTAVTLEEVISAYAQEEQLYNESSEIKSVKFITSNSSPNKNFALTLQQRKALISFLLSLSDSSILTNPAYANPFKEDETKR